MWWTVRNSSTISTNSAHTARRPYGTTPIGFTSPYGFALRPLVHGSPKFAPHCLLNNETGRYRRFIGVHMNLGNPIGVVPLRETTGLCGGAIHRATSSLSHNRADAKVSHRRNFCVRLHFSRISTLATSTFSILNFRNFRESRNRPFGFFKTFALYNAMGPRRSWPGMTPASGRPATSRRGERSVTGA